MTKTCSFNICLTALWEPIFRIGIAPGFRSGFNNLKYPERVLASTGSILRLAQRLSKPILLSAYTASLGVSREEADEIIARGCAIARAAQGTNATVFASIGPVSMQQEKAGMGGTTALIS